MSLDEDIPRVEVFEGTKNPSDVMDYEGDIAVYGGDENELALGSKVREGDIIGYDEQGQLHVIYSEVEPRDGNSLDVFAERSAEALNLDPVAYFDAGSHENVDNAMTGERLAEIAERNLNEETDMEVETKEDYGVVKLS